MAAGEADGDVHSWTCYVCECCNHLSLVKVLRLLQDDGLQRCTRRLRRLLDCGFGVLNSISDSRF